MEGEGEKRISKLGHDFFWKNLTSTEQQQGGCFPWCTLDMLQGLVLRMSRLG